MAERLWTFFEHTSQKRPGGAVVEGGTVEVDGAGSGDRQRLGVHGSCSAPRRPERPVPPTGLTARAGKFAVEGRCAQPGSQWPRSSFPAGTQVPVAHGWVASHSGLHASARQVRPAPQPAAELQPEPAGSQPSGTQCATPRPSMVVRSRLQARPSPQSSSKGSQAGAQVPNRAGSTTEHTSLSPHVSSSRQTGRHTAPALPGAGTTPTSVQCSPSSQYSALKHDAIQLTRRKAHAARHRGRSVHAALEGGTAAARHEGLCTARRSRVRRGSRAPATRRPILRSDGRWPAIGRSRCAPRRACRDGRARTPAPDRPTPLARARGRRTRA